MENRTRKVGSQFSRQEWRNKAAGNSAQLKYSREQILRNYKNLKQPSFTPSSELSDYILSHASPPLLTAIFPFSHSLGEEVNSRKHLGREKRVEQMPEWYEDEEPKETTTKVASTEIAEKVSAKEEPVKEIKVVLTSKHVKNLEKGEEKDLEDQFSKIDLKVEEKLKKEVVEDEYAAPEWDDPVDEEFVFDSFEKEKERDMDKGLAKAEGKGKDKGKEGLFVQSSIVSEKPGPGPRSPALNVAAVSSPKVLSALGQAETAKAPETKVGAKPPAPVFDMNLLRYHQAIRNPFIQILMDYGTPVGANSMTFAPATKPYEKIWFYKDLDNNVQGPFSTLEMFAWTIRDCFPPDLEISIGTPGFFVPMNIFNECSQFEKEEEANEAPAVISDSNFSLYRAKVEPPDVISLDDVQGSVFASNEKPDKPESSSQRSPEVLTMPIKAEPPANPANPASPANPANPDKPQHPSRHSLDKLDKLDRPERKPKPGRKSDVQDHRPDRSKACTLEEIEKMQQHRVGKAAESSSQAASKVMKSNDAATFELKNMLGLISKK